MSKKMIQICKRCILPSNFKDISFSEEGICSYCQENRTVAKQVHITDEKRKQYCAEIDTLIDTYKGKGLYDCVVGFSGGKDSTYLLWKLKNEYNLNVLAVVIDHGYFPDVTIENINELPRKMGIDVIKYNINTGFMDRFFKKKFETYETKAIFDDVCADCSNILEGNVIKVAQAFKIPLVFIGLSPEQVNRYFFEMPEDHLDSNWRFDESEYFQERDYLYSWQGKELDELKVILPFHVWEYDESEIVELLEKENLVNKEKSNPMMTRCKILYTMCYLDKKRIGYDGFIAPFSDLIRMGKASREKYYEMFYGNAYQLNMKHVDEVVERLNLDMDMLINKKEKE